MLNSLRRGDLARFVVRGMIATALTIGATVAARADFVVNATVRGNGGLYDYAISIANKGPESLALVSLFQPGVTPLIQNASAPAGYEIDNSSDGTTGYVDFFPSLGASGFLPGSSVGLFRFQSDTLALSGQIYGIDAAGNNTDNGTLASTAILSVAPEPGSLALIAPALLAGAIVARRRAAKK